MCTFSSSLWMAKVCLLSALVYELPEFVHLNLLFMNGQSLCIFSSCLWMVKVCVLSTPICERPKFVYFQLLFVKGQSLLARTTPLCVFLQKSCVIELLIVQTTQMKGDCVVRCFNHFKSLIYFNCQQEFQWVYHVFIAVWLMAVLIALHFNASRVMYVCIYLLHLWELYRLLFSQGLDLGP